MHLAAVSIVRSECDIIESFVRHNATFFDRLYIIDHRSTDTTPDILRRLADDGLPLVLSREGYGIFYQGPSMTQLIKRACDDHPWDFIIPLDSDEFLRVPDRATLEAALADLDPASIGLSEVVNYIPTASDDPYELDVLRRIVHCAKTRPDTGSKICKVIIPSVVIRQPVGEYDGHTLECALSVKAELNACAEEKRAVQAALERQAAVAAGQLAEAEAANKCLRIQFDAILASTSWRMTAPIRAGSRCLSALRLLGRRR